MTLNLSLEADRVADSSALPTDNSPDAADPPQATLPPAEESAATQ